MCIRDSHPSGEPALSGLHASRSGGPAPPGRGPDRGTIARDQPGLRDCDRTCHCAGPRPRRGYQPASGPSLRLHATAPAGGKYEAERRSAGGRAWSAIHSLRGMGWDSKAGREGGSEEGAGEPLVAAGGGEPLVAAGHGEPLVAAGGGEPPVAAGGGEPLVAAGGGEPLVAAGGGEPLVAAGGGEPPVADGGGEPLVAAGWDQGF